MFHGLELRVQILETVFVVGILAALLLLLMNLKRPKRLLLALISIPRLAFLGYGVVHGIFWYFMIYLPSKGGPIIELGP